MCRFYEAPYTYTGIGILTVDLKLGMPIGNLLFLRGSGKLKPIPVVSGLGLGGISESICFRFEVNLKFIFIEKNFLFLITGEQGREKRPGTSGNGFLGFPVASLVGF